MRMVKLVYGNPDNIDGNYIRLYGFLAEFAFNGEGDAPGQNGRTNGDGSRSGKGKSFGRVETAGSYNGRYIDTVSIEILDK